MRGFHVAQKAAIAQVAPPANKTRVNHNLSPLRPLPRPPVARRCPPPVYAASAPEGAACLGLWEEEAPKRAGIGTKSDEQRDVKS